MTTGAHHLKFGALSEQDRRNIACRRQWLARLAVQFIAVDPLIPGQRALVTERFRDKQLKAQVFLACRAARIRDAIRQTMRHGLRVITGGRK